MQSSFLSNSPFFQDAFHSSISIENFCFATREAGIFGFGEKELGAEEGKEKDND